VKVGLFNSSDGTGIMSALPYAPPLKKIPPGYTLSGEKAYCRTMRRISPSRWPVLNIQNARSRKCVLCREVLLAKVSAMAARFGPRVNPEIAVGYRAVVVRNVLIAASQPPVFPVWRSVFF